MSSHNIKEIQKFLNKAFPESGIIIESLGHKKSSIRKVIQSKDLRPGQTISGPTLMGLADASLYITIMGENISHQAVTSQLSINFLKKPNGTKDVIAECELLKIGRSLIMGEIKMFSDGETDIIAHATVTYSVPQKSGH